MTARILNGKELAARIRQDLKQKVECLSIRPQLAIILIGTDPASQIYVRNKIKAAEEIGIKTRLLTYSEDVTQNELTDLILSLNRDNEINGIMIQLPLPKHLNEKEILKTVNPQKDVDGFHPLNVGLLQNNEPQAVIAATPKGILRLLKENAVELSGKQALIIGRSQIVGKPAAMLLLNQDCTVTVAHSHTQNLPALLAQADIVVSACGCPELIKGEWLKKDAVIIDVGINHKDGKLCGDVDFASAVRYVGMITPVPGGVGPMTIAMLLENTYEAYLKQNND